MNEQTPTRTRPEDSQTAKRASGLRVKSGLRAGADKQKYLEVRLQDVLVSSY